MPVSTSDGKYFENDEDFWHDKLFGQKQEQSEGATGDSKLYLVRHGDTALNDEDLVHGWVDEPLNESGIEQAHKAAKSLENKDITRIVSSDLPRAKQSANIISKATGAPVTFDPNLRTWDSGDLDFTDKHSELDKYAEDKTNEAPPGSSESFNQFKDRILTALTGHAANNDGHNTAIVTHSKGIGVMNAWEHAGYPEDQSIHQATYDKKDDIKPGGHEELSIPEHVLTGVDLTPMHRLGTQPKDYLTELLHNPDILDKNIEQASNFNFLGSIAKFPLGHFIPGGEGLTKIRQMLKEGSTQKEIAEEFGVSIPRVNQLIKRNGLNYDPNPDNKHWGKVNLDDLRDLVAKREESRKPPFTNKRMTWDDIGKQIGVTGTGAYLQAQRMGLTKERIPTKLQPGEPEWLADELGLKK